jgi:hypothetical protein
VWEDGRGDPASYPILEGGVLKVAGAGHRSQPFPSISFVDVCTGRQLLAGGRPAFSKIFEESQPITDSRQHHRHGGADVSQHLVHELFCFLLIRNYFLFH